MSRDLERIRETCGVIKADIAADVARHEGQLFTGRNVSEQFGELSACVSALAGMIDQLAYHLQVLPETRRAS